MTDYLSIIKLPIEVELNEFTEKYNASLEYKEGVLKQALDYVKQRKGKRMRPMLLLKQALDYVKQRKGKRMRPMLLLLMAKLYGNVTETTLRAGIGLEMLHTATLIHDDIVDESSTRRGQASVNAIYDNKIAVLVGDYILSTALINVSDSKDIEIIKQLSILGQTLSDGEILQLTSNVSENISEQAYYEVIRKKTAALFEAASAMGAMSVNASINSIEKARSFGQKIGMIFQIRDDIFDYYDSGEIGKPTGNDMLEGKLTLPAIYAILSSDNAEMKQIAMDVKACKASAEEIARLIEFSKEQGGIKYAEDKMMEIRGEAMEFINKEVHDSSLKNAFTAYLDYAIERNK